jgi:ABC-type Na+ efflux pump permease subunit
MEPKKAFKDTVIGGFLSKVAPNVVDMVGDIFPPAKLLSGLFNTQPDILPEQRMEFERLVKDYEAGELKAYLDDIANAREMQKTALNQQDTFSKRFIYYFASVCMILIFIYAYLVTFVPIPIANQQTANTLTGIFVGSVFMAIIGYFFGSSKSSADKNDLLKNLTNK